MALLMVVLQSLLVALIAVIVWYLLFYIRRMYRQQLERLVAGRTEELVKANDRLKQEVKERICLEGEWCELLAQLQTERAQLEVILRYMPAGVVIAEAPSGKIILTNPRCEEIYRQPLGCCASLAECAVLSGRHEDGSSLPLEEYALFRSVTKAEIVTGQELKIKRGDGTEGMICINSAPVFDSSGQVIAAVAIFHDITEAKKLQIEMRNHRECLEELVAERTRELTGMNELLKQQIGWRTRMEAALGVAERRFRAAFEYSAVGMALISPDGQWLEVNRALCQMVGYAERELLRMTVSDITHPDDRAEQAECIGELLAGIIVSYRLEKRYRHKLGNDVWALVNVALMRDNKGKPLHFIAQIQNLSPHKQAEKALRMTEDRFAKAFHNNPCMMAIARLADGVYLDINNSFARHLGYSREEIIGRTASQIGFWADKEKRKMFLDKLVRNGQVRDLEVKFRGRTGDSRDGIVSADIVDIHGNQCILSVVYDTTERKKMEREIARLDRLNLVGQMAASIGHEIRNPMTTVRGYLQLLKAKKDCKLYVEHFDIMIDELDRANFIISEFLSLARNKAVEFQPVSLNSIVEAVYPLIRADAIEAGKDVAIDLAPIPELLLNEKEIRQVILNLVRNGLEAMSAGGVVTIRTYLEGAEAVMAVEDKGAGIEADLLDRLGTPFLTTKDQGTGLGLAVCFSIANRHQAEIKVDTGPGGTVFYVRFKIDKEA